jgi:Snf7
MDDIQTQMDLATEIDQAISQPLGGVMFDEDELDAELEALEQESLDQQLLNINAPATTVPAQPESREKVKPAPAKVLRLSALHHPLSSLHHPLSSLLLPLSRPSLPPFSSFSSPLPSFPCPCPSLSSFSFVNEQSQVAQSQVDEDAEIRALEESMAL